LVFDEFVSEDLGISTFSDQVLLHCAQHYPNAKFEDNGDPAGNNRSKTDERSCFEILRAKGILVQPGEQTPTMQIESLRKPLNSLVEG